MRDIKLYGKFLGVDVLRTHRKLSTSAIMDYRSMLATVFNSILLDESDSEVRMVVLIGLRGRDFQIYSIWWYTVRYLYHSSKTFCAILMYTVNVSVGLG